MIASGKSPGIGGKLYYGYEENLYDKGRQTFEYLGLPVHENNVFLVKGLYQDTMRISRQVALAHIDCDWYESVMTCLKQIEPYLVRGGLLVIDDYYSWSGCATAVDEYFSARKNHFKFLKAIPGRQLSVAPRREEVVILWEWREVDASLCEV